MLRLLLRNKFSCFLSLFIFLSLLSANAADLRETYESAVQAYNQGQYDKAIELYQSINKMAPDFSPAYIGLGLALKDKGAEPEEVLYYYKMAIEKDPNNVQALEQLARLYYSNNQMDKAKGTFERILKINPNATSVKFALGWICLTGKKTNPEQAIIYFQDVIKATPNPNAYFGLGMAYFSDNQREKALDILTQLKMMKEETLANKLEKALRENRRVVVNESADDDENQGDKNKNSGAIENTPDGPKGVKVRLRGKLDNLQ